MGDTNALYALDFSRRTLTRLTLKAGPVVPAEVYLLDSPALLDAAGAPRLLRGYAASDGWLFLLVESDLPLKTDLLTLRLADGRWQTMERQNIQAIAACGNGTVLMASYDIRDEMSGCEIFRYNAESGETALFAALPSLRPESLAFVPEENLVCLEMDGTVYLCKEHDTVPLPIARLGETAPVSYACLVDVRYLSLRAAGGITAITVDLEGIEPVGLTFADAAFPCRTIPPLCRLILTSRSASAMTHRLCSRADYGRSHRGRVSFPCGVPAVSRGDLRVTLWPCLKMRFSWKLLPPTLPSPKRSIPLMAYWPPFPWAISMRRFCTKFKGADSISTHPHKGGAQFLHYSIPRDDWTA